MSDPGGPRDEPLDETREGPGDPQEAVGSVGEEAAKLFGALSDWARDQGAEQVGDRAGAAAAGARDALVDGLHGLGEHVATGGQDCRYCPVCQVIHAVRQTSPEVREHLARAATSLVQAAAGLLAPPARERGPVERIDLDDEAGWDEQEQQEGEPGR